VEKGKGKTLCFTFYYVLQPIGKRDAKIPDVYCAAAVIESEAGFEMETL